MFSSSNIKHKSFSSEKNGYSTAEVDSFLVDVAKDYDTIVESTHEKDEKIKNLEKKIEEYKEDEDAIKMALLSAQKEANRILADAKTKAKNLVESAKAEQMKLAEQSAAECERIVNEHKEKCAQLIKENTEATDKKIRSVRAAYEDQKTKLEEIRAEVTYFKATLTDLYNKQIRLVMELPTLTDEELEKYENGYFIDEEIDDEEYDDEPYVEEETETAQESPALDVDEILSMPLDEPVIPKSDISDLQFGKNN